MANTYEYKCAACGVVEVEQRITDAALDSCPRCGGPVERMISASTFVLKGDGWPSKYYRSDTSKIIARDLAAGK